MDIITHLLRALSLCQRECQRSSKVEIWIGEDKHEIELLSVTIVFVLGKEELLFGADSASAFVGYKYKYKYKFSRKRPVLKKVSELLSDHRSAVTKIYTKLSFSAWSVIKDDYKTIDCDYIDDTFPWIDQKSPLIWRFEDNPIASYITFRNVSFQSDHLTRRQGTFEHQILDSEILTAFSDDILTKNGRREACFLS